tara:strand:+ start:308 stop:694 length:387 start_codon:yes stop_codon:yes gene_type:complete
MSKDERIDLTQFEHDANNPPEEIDCADCGRTIESESGDNFFACHRCGWSGYPSDAQAIDMVDELVAELKRMYKREDLLWKAFIMAGNHGYHMTICEECDDVHTLDDECPFICKFCCEKDCECPPSEEG